MTKSTTTKRIKGRKRIAILITSAVLVAAGAGSAFAYWSAQGTGSGSAASGTSVPFTVATTNTSSSSAALTPGGPTQTINFTVTHSGTGNQYLNSVSAVVASTVVTGTATTPGAWSIVTATGATCSAGDYTVGTPSFTKGSIAPSGSISGTVTITMNNLDKNQDACKGASVPLYLTAS
jgi:hypothetical protein